MSTAVLTPYQRDTATRVGPRLFRKQVLPVGSIDYKGRRLDFTRDYLATLKTAFDGGAYDSVKFLLADKDNAHTEDPERMRGTVKAVELTDDGLDALIELSAEAAQLVGDHPDLGVSARIVEDLAKSDGRAYPQAIKHVLGTLDPRVTGMRPWQAVDLADDTTTTVLDLTEATYLKEQAVADTPTLEEQIAALPEDERAALLAKHVKPEPEPELSAEEQAEVDALVAAMQDDAELEPVALSADQQAAIDLSNANALEAVQRAKLLEADLAASKWAAEKQQLLNAGVPKADLDLAEPVLSLPESAVIDLSDTEKIDASAVIRRLIENRKGTVDLSVRGDAESEDDSTARDERVTAYRDRFDI